MSKNNKILPIYF